MTLGEKSKNKELKKKVKIMRLASIAKNIGMQNSTLKKMLIIPGRHGFSAWIKALPYAEKKKCLIFCE